MATSSFTHNGDYFALLSVDGRLRIWDTTSGKVVQEFSSNSAAQSSCTCVCWTRKNFTRLEKKNLKRKQKKNEKAGIECVFLPSIAIGTDKGYLFCYNPTSGEIEKCNMVILLKSILWYVMRKKKSCTRVLKINILQNGVSKHIK